MQLQLQNFSTLVSNAAAAVQGSAAQLIDLTVGSTLRAILEANASLALWMQWLIVQVLATTRAATSNGTDLDTWCADFALARLPAVPATGLVTFSRFTPTLQAVIPAATLVRTANGLLSFSVIADPNNPAWSQSLNGYTLGAGVASLTVSAVATASGSLGNVQPGTISLIASAVSGIDTVTNQNAFVGGLDAEADAPLRTRFSGYLASRARGTSQAIDHAILSVRQGLTYTLQENVVSGGTPAMGCFIVTVDDGTGSPSATLLTQVAEAIEAVRPIGSTYSVQSPMVTLANVSLSITTPASSAHIAIAANVVASLQSSINALPIGASLPWSRLTQLAYAADPNVINVTNVLLNLGTTDVTPGPAGLVKAGSLQVA